MRVALLATAVVMAALPSPAMAQSRNFSVPAGEANKTLPEFARQSGIQIIAPSEQLRGIRTPAIVGRQNVREALARLLSGTDLVIAADTGMMVTLKPRSRARIDRTRTILASASLPTVPRAMSDRAPAMQEPPAPPQESPAEESSGQLDIVVTATKQASPLSRVPISVTAVTREQLDKQSIRQFSDIVRTVPAVNLTASTIGDRIPNISVRGVASSSGAPTTGIYLDDTPLQKRNAIGISGSGTPIPALFDLERVEVLRGPQGTLFGGSSLGGTIRFITPAPSLDRMTGYARAEIGFINQGGVSYEAGAAIGGPIVEDRLGGRISVWTRRFGGYVDHVDRLSGATLDKDSNTSEDVAVRGALLWQPTTGLSITPALYYSRQRQNDSDTQWKTVPATTRAGVTYPQATYGDYETGVNCNYGDIYAATARQCAIYQPRTVEIVLPSLKADYDFGWGTATSITSYLHDRTWGLSDYSYVEPANFQAGFPFVRTLTSYQSTPIYENTRDGFTQELRLASNDADAAFTWVVGAYFSKYENNSNYHIVANLGDLTQAVFGRTPQQVLGVGVEPGNITYHRDQNLDETSLAGFGEVAYRIVGGLKLLAGVRISREEFSYDQNTAGTFAGFLTPTVANGGLTNGKVKETPISPKFGLQWQVDPRNMVYATAAKGFRVGGINQPPPAARCATDLALLGITSTPGTYAADELWSYEVGAKLRTRDGRAQLNSSAYYIDWSNIQTSYGLPTCGFGYTINGGKAISKGFDLQLSVEPVAGLVLNGTVAHTDAQYTEPVIGPAPARTLYIADGDKLPVAPWSINLGGEYGFNAGGFRAFVRADYQYASEYERGTGPGTSGYTPDTYINGEAHYMTARAGFGRDGWQLSVFADNLLNSKDELGLYGGRTGCTASGGNACATFRSNVLPFQYATFRPRTIGLTLTVRQ